MSPFAWIAIGFIVGAVFGVAAILVFLSTIPGNFAHMLHQTPKE